MIISGSVSVVSNRGHIFTGDAFLGQYQLMFVDNPTDFSNSLSKLAEMAADSQCVAVYPGHSNPSDVLLTAADIANAKKALDKAVAKGWLHLNSEGECREAWASEMNSSEGKCSPNWVQWSQFLQTSIVQIDNFHFALLRQEHHH